MSQFKVNPENRRKRDAVLNLLRTKQRGDLVSHEEIGRACGLEPNTQRYNRIVYVARNLLTRESGIWSVAIPGEGCHLYTVHEQLTDEQALRHRKIDSQFGRKVKAAKSVPDEGLHPNDRRIKDATISQDHSMRRLIREQQSVAEMASRPNSRSLIRPNPEADAMRVKPADEGASFA